jgi:hypothetical protein
MVGLTDQSLVKILEVEIFTFQIVFPVSQHFFRLRRRQNGHWSGVTAILKIGSKLVNELVALTAEFFRVEGVVK